MKTIKLQDVEFDQENEEEAGVPADVNAKDIFGLTPLGGTVGRQNCGLFHKYGAEIGAVDSIHAAAWLGNIRYVKQQSLLHQKCNLLL